jgi:hypothetical protein
MKIVAKTICPNGTINEVVIDLCCCRPATTPPPGEPDFQFEIEAPGGVAIHPSGLYDLSKELRQLSELAAYPLSAIGGFSLDDVSSTYGYVESTFIEIDSCDPGQFPIAELYGTDDVWHNTVKFVADADGKIFLVPAYAATWMPLDTARIALTTTACAQLPDNGSSSEVSA